MKSKTAARKAIRPSNGVFVDLMTPKGKVFSGRAAAVRFSLTNTVVQLEPGAVSYFGLINSGEVVLRTGNKFKFFALSRGSASIRGRRLTVLAKTITLVTAPFENCGNPTCDCDDIILDDPNAIPPSKVSSIFRPRREGHQKSSTEISARAKPQKEEKEAMKPENAELKWDDQCAVCGKSVGHGEGFSHLNIEDQMIALCCPLCFETFEKDPAN